VRGLAARHGVQCSTVHFLDYAPEPRSPLLTALAASMASSLCFASRNRSSASRASGENRKVFGAAWVRHDPQRLEPESEQMAGGRDGTRADFEIG
jgi:hypothetical protein